MLTELTRGRAALTLLAAATAIAVAGCGATPVEVPRPAASASGTDDVARQLSDLEDEFDARIGLSLIDTGTGDEYAFRGDERFGYASTLKVFAAAEFLRVVPASDRDETVIWTQADVDSAGYSPVTAEFVDEGLPLTELAEAAVRDSDNTALNIVLERVGGPAALDASLQALGDSVTEVVNDEPELNDVIAGETDDTTSPVAFTRNLEAILGGEVLDDEDTQILLDWMSGNPTGDTLIRAGAPDGWTVADKSGGAGAIRNDIAVVTPPGREPIVISILTVKNDPNAEYDDALVSGAAEIVLREFA